MKTIWGMRFNGETEFRKRIVFFCHQLAEVSSFNRYSLKTAAYPVFPFFSARAFVDEGGH
jgi:hypothetical protein